MRLARTFIMLTALAAISLPVSAEAAERLVIGEMFTSTT
jgi:hypothetical protein